MSTNTNTDLTEEDAADLQFPKGRLYYCKHFIHVSCFNCFQNKAHEKAARFYAVFAKCMTPVRSATRN